MRTLSSAVLVLVMALGAGGIGCSDGDSGGSDGDAGGPLVPPVARFVACADGVTVADNETGLLWERKTGTFDASFPASGICETAPLGCPDPHDVNNLYQWSSTGTVADGNAYTDFLESLNTGSFAGHADWRLPIISELQSILVGSGVTTTSTSVDPADPAMGTNPTGQSGVCSSAPCIDPRFAAIGGPAALSGYWSASTFVTSPDIAWFARFTSGTVDNFNGFKTEDGFVRAVRAGSCSS